LPDDEIFDLEQHGKLHVLSGGTKVVQHSPPLKTSAGLKGNSRKTVNDCVTSNVCCDDLAVGLCNSLCGRW